MLGKPAMLCICRDMLSVIIECDNNEAELAHSLSALVTGAVEGLVSDVIVLDHGSADGSERVAEAAGCRYFRSWNLEQVIAETRGDWIMVLEPGARPLTGWVEAVSEHIATDSRPARFSCSRHHRMPFWNRLFSRRCPLEVGLIMPKAAARERAAASGPSPFTLAGRMVTRRLSCELVPARVMMRV